MAKKKISAHEKKVEKVMREFYSGKLHSGSKKGPTVTKPKQGIAIALSEARRDVSGERPKWLKKRKPKES